jgi:EAL domain-containing protein (putative c-di-GMP-specific phosphodiesterase class I)
VDGVVDDPDDRTIVEAVVGLGRALGLTCLAEGVETDDQRGALVGMGCQLGQGYLWARPMPEADARRWLFDRVSPRP